MARDLFSAIHFAGNSLTGARLKRVRGEWSLTAPESLDIPDDTAAEPESPPAGPADGAAPRAAQVSAPHAVRRFTASFPDAVTLCLESRAALFQYLSIPPADDEEIPGMVLLQLEERKLLPLPAEEMTVAIETLDRSDDALQLLVAAVPTAHLDAAIERIGLAKTHVHRIDIGALAALRALRDSDSSPLLSPGRHLLLLDEAGFWTAVIVDSGRPVLVRPLGAATLPARALLRTLRLSLLQAESERDAPDPLSSISVLAGHPAPELLPALRDAFRCDVRALDRDAPAALCAAGAARRSAESAAFDLVPAAWRDELADRRHRRFILQAIVVGIALWVLAAAALFLGPSLLDKAIASEESALRTLDPAVQTVSDVRHRVRVIRTYMDRTFSPLEVFREICLLLPDGITFTSLRYRREDSRVTIGATASSTGLVYEFKRNVDKSETFSESQLTSGPTTNPRTGGADFELSVILATPQEEEAAQ